MKNKSAYILTVEAKDLYNSNNLVYNNEIGYNVRRRDGSINTHKYINALDFSLDLIKLREIYEKVYRRHNFTFNLNRKEFTQHVINVKFNYSFKEFNKSSKNKYVLNGYLWKDVQLNEHICVKDGKLIGIETNTPVEQPYKDLSVLGESFVYENGMYKATSKIKTLLSKKEIRSYLYENGFMCDGIKYIRWKRSSGSGRVGKCLFINEALYKRIHKWETCELNPADGDEIDLAAFESYISLTSSSIIDTIDLKPENFLVVDDYTSVFKDTVIGVQFEEGHLIAREQEFEIENSIFDGETLMDESCFPEKYQDRSMLLLRQRMFKSACFKTKVQKWFKDNNITDVSQLNGFTLAKNIGDVKIITTPSSIKYLKFGNLRKWLESLEPTFGIVKHEKPTHYFDGRKVSCHYQLINTLQLSQKDVNSLLKDSFDYISKIRQDPAVLRYHISYPYDEIEITPLNSKNEIVFKLLGMNSNFAKTKLYYDFRNDLVKSLIRELKQGHVLVDGNYSTLLGNGYEMLQQAIGTFKGESILGKGKIHNRRFEYNKTILGSRSPHVCSGNVLLVTNVASEEIDKYFDLSDEIVYVNAIGENIQQRCNGCDYDSDTLLLTDNQLFINAAQKNYDKFKVPTCFVSAQKIKRYYTDEHKTDLDVKTSVNKIGEIINLSQQLNSLMWDNIHKGQTIEDNAELYQDICKLAVLSNIEIDKAKKEYEVNSVQELNLIKSKYQILKYIKDKETDENVQKVVKPMFFKMITLENGYELSERHLYRYFHTPMDYVQKRVASFNFNKNKQFKNDYLPFSTIVKPCEIKGVAGSYYEQCERILSLVDQTYKNIQQLYIGYDEKTKEEKEEIKNQVCDIKQECVDYVNDLVVSERTMYLLLLAMDKKENRRLQKLIFTTLFGTPNKLFFTMILENKGEIYQLLECENGDISLYDFKFKKVKIK